MRKSLWLMLAVTILSAACSGQVSSPASPSGLAASSTPSATGATVNGTVRLGATAPVLGSAADPMKVEVVNTSIVSVVSAAGQFELTNVPAGQVRLRFFGAGADASVSISEVKAGETVTISVTVVGTSAALESERHSSASEEQVEINGIVENLTGSALAFQFFVSGRLIKGDSQTEFFGNGHRDTFADLSSQDRVEVKGQQRDGYVYAVRLHINDGNDDADDDDDADNDDDADEVELKGAVTGASGTCPGVVTFTLQGKTVMTSLSTTYRNLTCDDLKNVSGLMVEVEGTMSGTSVQAKKIEREDNHGDDHGGEVRLSGAVTGASGSCSTAVTFTVQGRTVVTGPSTTYKDMSCTDLITRTGLKVEVRGTQSGSSVQATRIEKD